jgi:hypothetical protein
LILELRPNFETAEAAFEWIRSGVFMLFSSLCDSVLVMNDDGELVAEWSLRDDMNRKEDPKGKQEINIHLDCNDQARREKEFWDHIRAGQEQIKELTGSYPHEVFKARLDELNRKHEGTR